MKQHNCPTCGSPLLFSPCGMSSSLKDYVDQWIDKLRLEQKSNSYIRKVNQRARDYILPFFSSGQLSDMTTYHVQVFYQHLLKRGHASKTTKHILDTLRALLAHLLVMQVIERMPIFPAVRVVRARPKQWIDAETQSLVIDAIAAHHRLIFRVLCETGIRPGEVCALKRRDLLRGGLVIERALGADGAIKGTKTGNTHHRPISVALYGDLLKLSLSMLPEAFLFTDEGATYTQAKVYHLWKRAAAKHGLDISIYQAARHSRVSQLRAAGELKLFDTLREELGHTSASTTLKHYALPQGAKI